MAVPSPPHPGALWEALTDQTTGYPYYWNTVTNQVRLTLLMLADSCNHIKFMNIRSSFYPYQVNMVLKNLKGAFSPHFPLFAF
jgi:hypothetical protein